MSDGDETAMHSSASRNADAALAHLAARRTARTRWSLLAAAMLALACTVERAESGPGQPPAAAAWLDETGFGRFIEETRLDDGVPGAVVVLTDVKRGTVVRGYGVRERGRPGRIDARTRFQIASVSKFLAATAVGTLVDRGLVSWDGPVRRFSPETVLAEPYATASATLRDYFAHRTGLPAYAGDLLADLGLPAEELVRRARFLPFDHTFRARMAYSNYGLFLGMQAAARAAGLGPAELLTRAILEPLAMTRSGPSRSALFEDDNRAAGHDLDGSVMPYEDVDAFVGAGAVVSTGEDIGRWMEMLLAGGQAGDRRILSKATLDQIFAASMVEGPSGPSMDANAAAGLGCDSYHFLGRRIIEKNGALNGVRTIVTLIPDLGLGIAVLANKQLTVFPEAVRAEFLQRRIGRLPDDGPGDLQARIRSEQAAWDAIVAVPSPPADAQPVAHALDAYTGRFDSPLYGSLRVSPGPGGLAVTISGRPALLTHWSGDSFLLRFPNPDLAPGLLTFTVAGDRAVRVEGSALPAGLSISYGAFERSAE